MVLEKKNIDQIKKSIKKFNEFSLKEKASLTDSIEMLWLNAGIQKNKQDVKPVKGENGFVAWYKLKQHFEPRIISQLSHELSEFGSLQTKQASDPRETRQGSQRLTTKSRQLMNYQMSLSQSYRRTLPYWQL